MRSLLFRNYYKKQIRDKYQKLADDQKLNYLYDLITQNHFSYHNLSGILKIPISEVINTIFIPLDIKICSRDDCCSRHGRIQSRSNFYYNSRTTDNLKPNCKIWIFKSDAKVDGYLYRKMKDEYKALNNFTSKLKEAVDRWEETNSILKKMS